MSPIYHVRFIYPPAPMLQAASLGLTKTSLLITENY